LEIDETFVMDKPTDDTCEFTFHLGGELAATPPYTVYLDDVSLYDPEYTKPVEYILPQPDVRVNQVATCRRARKLPLWYAIQLSR